MLASGSHECNIKLWAVQQSAEPRLLRVLADGPEVWSLAFSPDGALLASGSQDGVVRLWDPAGGQLIRKLTGHSAPVMSLAFSPDGQRLASGSWDQTAMLWEVTERRP